MRINTDRSIRTASSVHAHFGSWRAAKESARYADGKFIVRSASTGSAQGRPKAK
jgi:hypothetical protein